MLAALQLNIYDLHWCYMCLLLVCSSVILQKLLHPVVWCIELDSYKSKQQLHLIHHAPHKLLLRLHDRGHNVRQC